MVVYETKPFFVPFFSLYAANPFLIFSKLVRLPVRVHGMYEMVLRRIPGSVPATRLPASICEAG